ncbi:glycosyltransferase, partial [Escherichia coli]|uniref:glycosyltransferase n=1 Tax=Escherichia coli TaxID=562 RepID=UPI00192BAF6E
DNEQSVSENSREDYDSKDIMQKLGLQRKRYILTVGRLVPEKNQHFLIDAFLSSGSKYDLVIAGAADHKDSYATDLIARGGGNIKFIGFQPHSVLGELYQQAGVFVLPSLHEGLPIAALEAGAVGCAM